MTEVPPPTYDSLEGTKKRRVQTPIPLLCCHCEKELQGAGGFEDGKLYCEECYRDCLCPGCAKRTFQQKAFCTNCHYKRVKCAFCAQWTDEGTVHWAQVFCSTCSKQLTHGPVRLVSPSQELQYVAQYVVYQRSLWTPRIFVHGCETCGPLDPCTHNKLKT